MKVGFTVAVGVWLLVAYGLIRNPVAAAVVLGAIWLIFLFFDSAAARWVWAGYSPAARRRRRGTERLVGPEGRSHLPGGSPRRSLGPAFRLQSQSRPRGARRGAARR